MIVARFAVVCVVGAALLLSSDCGAQAANFNWSVSSGSWSIPANWGSTVLPGSADTALVENGGTATNNLVGAACDYLFVGGGSTGVVQMTSGSLATGSAEYIGYSDTGTFVQSGGTNGLTPALYLGCVSGVSGAYTLSNSGMLSANYEYVGSSGTGTFNQTGGTNATSGLYLSNAATAQGTYTLSGGVLAASGTEAVGYAGPGTFTHSGGTNSVFSLFLGYNTGGSAKYTLSSSGLLSAVNEYIGIYSSGGTLNQTGGSNQVAYLGIGSRGSYLLGGGTLQVNSLVNQGVLNASGGNGLLIAGTGSIIDLSQGTLNGAGSLSLAVSADSLLLVPQGFNPAAFQKFTISSLALTHTIGSTLTVAAAHGFSGVGTLTDLVSCQGTISATPGGWIDLSGGVYVSASGSLSLGSGNYIVNNTASGISGGSLAAVTGYVGYSGTGAFSQSGGTNTLASGLVLGSGSGDSGTYSLSGAALLSTSSEQLGLAGSGAFTQSGGMNSVGSSLYLGQATGSVASYSLSGAGLLAAPVEYVGWSGAGVLKQSGGTNSVTSALYVGYNSGGSGGTCSLSGSGALVAANEYIGWRSPGTFSQTGGTNTVTGSIYLGYSSTGSYNLNGGILVVSGIDVSSNADFNLGGGTLRAGAAFTTSQPLTLSGNDGNASIDTGGYAVALSGALSGPGGLIKLGSGQLILSGSDSYTGGTYVDAGALIVAADGAIPVGNLTVGVGGTVIFDTAAAGGPVESAAVEPSAGAIAAVPEPGTLLLLVAGLLAGFAARQRKT